MDEKLEVKQRVKHTSKGMTGIILSVDGPVEGTTPIATSSTTYSVEWDDGQKETLLLPAELEAI